MLQKQRSIFDIRPEPDDHPYQSYRSTSEFIKRYVNQAITNALKIIDTMGTLSYDNMRQIGYFKNRWAVCGYFNARNGEASIIAEMTSWSLLPALKDWMFHVNFISLNRKGNTEFYTYQVLWSVPTPMYPEPQVTVSVFFYIASSKVYPSHFPVDVKYRFEGYQFFHDINMIFRPKWLYDVLDMKTMMFKTFDF